MRYKNENYTEKYLVGGEATVSYNPEDVSCVWLIENGVYICFELIESRYRDKELTDVEILQKKQKDIIKTTKVDNIQSQIDLANYIEVIASTAIKHDDVCIKDIRKTRKREQIKSHVDYMKGVK